MSGIPKPGFLGSSASRDNGLKFFETGGGENLVQNKERANNKNSKTNYFGKSGKTGEKTGVATIEVM